jgi:3D (Asp-Asp-Asp) domain-containing protein
MRRSSLVDTIAATPRRVAMWMHGLRVQTVLAVWLVPDRAVRGVDALRAMPRARLLATALLAVAVVAPSALYVHEHARRTELSRAYESLALSSTAEIATLRGTMGNLLDEQSEIKGLLLEAGYAVFSDNELSVPVVATGYSSTIWETDSTPFVTAANTRTRYGIVAMSRDLLRRYTPGAPFNFGDVVHLSGLGDFVVEDSMNARWRRRVDVWFPSRTAAVTFGRRNAIIRAKIDPGANDDETAYHYTAPINLAASP